MSESQGFTFGDSSIARSYDNALVPVLFEPWTERLIEEYAPWEGRRVLDLATGTGVVPRLLAEHVGPDGQIIGTDINGEMLSLAKARCAHLNSSVKFVECSADSLECPDGSMDFVVCQQGFQFFPDKGAAASAVYTVLRDGGRAFASTWQPVAECEFFGAICMALKAIGEPEIADMMRVPFDYMPGSELVSHFESAGFDNVQLTLQALDLVMEGGVAQAIDTAYSTPIGPSLRALPEAEQARFRGSLTEILEGLSKDSFTMGIMTSNVLSAEKHG